MKAKKVMAMLLCLAMLIGMLPANVAAASAGHDHVHTNSTEVPIPVTTEGKTYSLFTEDNLDDQHGTTFLYVVKRNGRYYTPAHPGYVGEFEDRDSVASVDITDYWDEETNTFSGIPDSANVGVMQYQTYPFPSTYGGQALFLDGNCMISLSVPFEDEGETWFDSGIDYYGRDNTYSYQRPLWEQKGGGSGYFYERYTDWWGSRETVYGVLALNSNLRFALRNYSEKFMAEEDINVNAYLYAAPCGHAAPEHSSYVAPTCMDKGCKEYWYCVYCDGYFRDSACTDSYGHKPVIPALGHDYGDTECANCHKPIPEYTKITSYEQFRTIKPGASFIVVAELDDGNGGKEYYALKDPVTYVTADLDEDGKPDILDVDEDSNGVPDILEQDRDGDGVADAMAYDGFISDEYLDGVLDEDEILEYLFNLEREYTDGYMVDARALEAIPVTPENGTINVKDLGVLEFVMERRFSDAELANQYYGDGITVKDYENDFHFRVPNFWVRPMVTMDNNWYQQPYERGDSKWWGVLFGKDVKEIADHYFEESFPDDAVVLYTESFGSLNNDGEVEHGLRFLLDGENKHFIITSYYYWEEIPGQQIPVYLYCSDPGEEPHEHIWSAWSPESEEIHKRVCTVEGCTAFDYGSHTPGAECTPDPENYELGHWVTCTECGGQIHEYHTRESAGRYYPNYWRDTGDGIHHVVYCTKCLGPVEYQEHDWSEWYAGAKEIDGQWVMGHYQSCDDWPCEAQHWRADCIYDEGTVLQEPTCTEPGLIRYTCQGESCNLDTRVRTEEIPALGHDWDEGVVTVEPTEETDGEMTYTCTRCSETRTEIIPKKVHQHQYETVVTEPTCTAPGYTTYTCACGDSYIGDEVPALGHKYESVVTDPTCTAPGYTTYTCACGDSYIGDEVPALGHDMGEWYAVTEPTCTEEGLEQRDCARCDHSETRVVEALGHKYESVVTDPTCTERGYTTHTCHCGDTYVDSYTDALGHDWDDGVVTKEPTEETEGERLFTCERCGETYTESIPVKDHEHKYESIVTDPTCTERGYTTHTCRCGDTYVDSYVDALGHDIGEWYAVEYPTCTEEGLEQRDCARCDYSETRAVEALGHKYEAVVTEPTCTERGYTTHTCHCGDSYVDAYVDALGHDWDNGVVTKEPTEETEGERLFSCNRCDATYTESIDKLPETHTHAWSDWEVYREPSSKESGEVRRYCDCGAYESEEIPALTNPFRDVKSSDFYYEPVLWAAWRGVTAGTSATTFAPNQQCTRGQVVTFLWRAMGQPEPESRNNPFRDVKESDFYYKAVLWAVENGITAGMGEGTFKPNVTCNRAQVVTFLWRTMGCPESENRDHPFRDVKEDMYYYEAMLWAVENGITAGYGATTFAPDLACTRGQVVTFLYRTLRMPDPAE